MLLILLYILCWFSFALLIKMAKPYLGGFICLFEVGLSLIQSVNSKEATIQSNNSTY